MPYEWFLALEQPVDKTHWFADVTRRGGKFSDTAYLAQSGCIPSEATPANPRGLPVGFTVTRDIPGADGEPYNAVGLTCAACHTGQLNHEGTTLLIDGGPAVISLDAFGEAMVVALLKTIAPTRYARFERNVLGDDATDAARRQMLHRFEDVVKGIKAEAVIVLRNKDANVTEGFARLDALNRIGNTVFGLDHGVNVAPTDAPVNYPHIWSSSWFD
jgi:hypothetical protein